MSVQYYPDETLRALLTAATADDACEITAILNDIITSPPSAVLAVLMGLASNAAQGLRLAAEVRGFDTTSDYLADHFPRCALAAEANSSPHPNAQGGN